MSSFTPGPWSVFIDDSGDQWTGWPLSITSDTDLNENGDGKLVVRTGGQWPYAWDYGASQREAVANARLIAAAPEMLASLRALLAWHDEYVDAGDAPAHEAARAAIAKATGA